MEKFLTADKKVIIYDNGSLQLVDPKELEKQKADIEARIEPQPDDKELLEWAKVNYPMVDHSMEIKELQKIIDTLSLIKEK
jgi:hypothetical protein